MITYALACEHGHRFDAWFKSAEAYDEQHRRGIVSCPVCMSGVVEKALMAPALSRSTADKVSITSGHPDQAKLLAAMRALRKKIVSEADYVGDKFAEEARRIHHKEVDARGIYGEATREEVSALAEDGIEFMPLPPLPEEHN